MTKRAFVTNIAYPKTLEEVLHFLNRGRFNTEDILAAPSEGGFEEWSVPSWAQEGDIAFFMHSKTSIDTIRHLQKELKTCEYELDPGMATRLFATLVQAKAIYDRIGGSVFAVGQVCGDTIVDNVAAESGLHWRNNVYAPINNIEVFSRPAHISKFRDFLKISRTGGITELDSNSFELLKALIAEDNALPEFLKRSSLSS